MFETHITVKMPNHVKCTCSIKAEAIFFFPSTSSFLKTKILKEELSLTKGKF